MTGRQAARAAAQRSANAAMCGVPITEWLALSRDARKRRLAKAKWQARQRKEQRRG